jgi:hypothetical protein
MLANLENQMRKTTKRRIAPVKIGIDTQLQNKKAIRPCVHTQTKPWVGTGIEGWFPKKGHKGRPREPTEEKRIIKFIQTNLNFKPGCITFAFARHGMEKLPIASMPSN